MAVRHALTTTTSSAELISSLARPNEGKAFEILCSADDMVEVEKCLADVTSGVRRVINRMIGVMLEMYEVWINELCSIVFKEACLPVEERNKVTGALE